jgi:hypothetical protein
MLHCVTARVVNIAMELGALISIEETVSVHMQCFLPIRTNLVKNSTYSLDSSAEIDAIMLA